MKTVLPYPKNKRYLIYRSGKVYNKKTKQYIGSTDKNGVALVFLSRKKGQEDGYGTQKVKYLVAELFVPNPDNLPEVINVNHNKADCRARNLKWVSRSGSFEHCKRKPVARGRRKTAHSTDEKIAHSLSTSGLNHYKSPGLYSKDGKQYETIAAAVKGSGENSYTVKRDTKAGKNGWSIIPHEEITTALEESTTFIQDEKNPESIF